MAPKRDCGPKRTFLVADACASVTTHNPALGKTLYIRRITCSRHRVRINGVPTMLGKATWLWSACEEQRYFPKQKNANPYLRKRRECIGRSSAILSGSSVPRRSSVGTTCNRRRRRFGAAWLVVNPMGRSSQRTLLDKACEAALTTSRQKVELTLDVRPYTS